MSDMFLDNPEGWKFPFYAGERADKALRGKLVVDMRIMIGNTELADSHEIIATPLDSVDYLMCIRKKIVDLLDKGIE